MSERTPTVVSLPGDEIGLPAPSHAKESRPGPCAEDYACFVAVMTEAFDRLTAGRRTYGPFRPESDRRNLCREAEEELLDAIAYCYFALLKLRAAARKGSR